MRVILGMYKLECRGGRFLARAVGSPHTMASQMAAWSAANSLTIVTSVATVISSGSASTRVVSMPLRVPEAASAARSSPSELPFRV